MSKLLRRRFHSKHDSSDAIEEIVMARNHFRSRLAQAIDTKIVGKCSFVLFEFFVVDVCSLPRTRSCARSDLDRMNRIDRMERLQREQGKQISSTKRPRRWCLHILPQGFTKTRSFGGWSNHHSNRYIEQSRELRQQAEPAVLEPTVLDETTDENDEIPTGPPCPVCGGELERRERVHRTSWRDIFHGDDCRRGTPSGSVRDDQFMEVADCSRGMRVCSDIVPLHQQTG